MCTLTISLRISGAPFTVARWEGPDWEDKEKKQMADILFKALEKWKRWTIFSMTFRPLSGVTVSPVHVYVCVGGGRGGGGRREEENDG